MEKCLNIKPEFEQTAVFNWRLYVLSRLTVLTHECCLPVKKLEKGEQRSKLPTYYNKVEPAEKVYTIQINLHDLLVMKSKANMI